MCCLRKHLIYAFLLISSIFFAKDRSQFFLSSLSYFLALFVCIYKLFSNYKTVDICGVVKSSYKASVVSFWVAIPVPKSIVISTESAQHIKVFKWWGSDLLEKYLPLQCGAWCRIWILPCWISASHRRNQKLSWATLTSKYTHSGYYIYFFIYFSAYI